MRRLIGVTGLLLPLLLVLADGEIQPSLSAYYHIAGLPGDVFVGGLCAIGSFLVCYHGYDRWDRLLALLAGLSAWGTAFFPTDQGGSSTWIGRLHTVCAGLLLLLLAAFAYFRFTRTDQHGPLARPKMLRNRIYRGSAIMVLVAVAAAGMVNALADHHWVKSSKIIFFLESLALLAFGIAWLVKGETLLRDPEVMEPSCPSPAG